MNTKTILSALAVVAALGAASPAFADRYENPEASAAANVYQDHGQVSVIDFPRVVEETNPAVFAAKESAMDQNQQAVVVTDEALSNRS